jgi:transcriptional regulator GlxA family with amidase domain
VVSVVNFIKSTLETAKNFPHLRASLLIKSNIEEISALYVTDLIADALKIPFNFKNTSADLDLVLSAEELIEGTPDKYFTIKEIADETFTTPRNLQIAFKKHRTYSPIRFLKERKVHLARKLILNAQSGSSIKRMALTTGISDINLFSVNHKHFFDELPYETLQRTLLKSVNL